MTDDLRDLVRRIERSSTPRRLARPPVSIPTVVEASGSRVAGLGRDLSEHGVRLRTARALPPHDRVRVRLTLPGHGELALDGDVRWARPDLSPGLFCVGIEFRHTDTSRHALRSLLVAHAKKALPHIRRTGLTTRRRRHTKNGDL